MKRVGSWIYKCFLEVLKTISAFAVIAVLKPGRNINDYLNATHIDLPSDWLLARLECRLFVDLVPILASIYVNTL
jgi:hypothetical protein